MRYTAKLAAMAASVAVSMAITLAPATAAEDGAKDIIAKGKELAYDRRLGNCLACHMMDDGVSPGDLGPPLVAMKARFPDKAKLRAQISNPEANNPNTMMPPFGKHKILTDEELDAVVEYVYSL